MSALARAVGLLGGATATSRLLGVTPQAVFFWLKGARTIPPEQCIAIERETAGQVVVEDLRPDVDWAVVRNGPTTSRQEAA